MRLLPGGECAWKLDRIMDFLAGKGRVADLWWRGTVLLLAGYLGLKSQEAALTLIQRLAVLDAAQPVSLVAAESAGVAMLEWIAGACE